MYSIDLEQVPDEINRHLEEVQQKHDSLSYEFDKIATTIEKGNFPLAIKSIEAIREKLAREDIRLEECTNILMGYQKALIDEQNKEPETTGSNSDPQKERLEEDSDVEKG